MGVYKALLEIGGSAVGIDNIGVVSGVEIRWNGLDNYFLRVIELENDGK